MRLRRYPVQFVGTAGSPANEKCPLRVDNPPPGRIFFFNKKDTST